MPNIRQQKKRLRQDIKKRARNVAEKSRLRSAIKRVRTASAKGDPQLSQAELKSTLSLLDRAGRRHLLHPRTADRRKGRLQRLVNKVPKG